MADLITLDFAAYTPQLTPEAQTLFDQWRAPHDSLLRACRQSGNWTWAGELVYRLNAVTRLCRKMPQPVSAEHMRVVLDAVSDTLPTVDTEIVSVSV